MADLYHLRNIQLDPELAAKLAPFVQAYRPHTQQSFDRTDPQPHVSRLNMREIMNEGLHMDD